MRNSLLLGLLIAPMAWAQATLEMPALTASAEPAGQEIHLSSNVGQDLFLPPKEEVVLPAFDEPVDPEQLKEAQEALKAQAVVGPSLPALVKQDVLSTSSPKPIEIEPKPQPLQGPKPPSKPQASPSPSTTHLDVQSAKHTSKSVFVIDPDSIKNVAKTSRTPKIKKTKKIEGFQDSHAIGEYWVDNEFDLDVILSQGQKMDDKFYLPGAPWGLGLFPGKDEGELLLMVSHKLGDTQQPLGAFGPDDELYARVSPDLLYMRGQPVYGGVSMARLDRYSSKPLELNLALAGTVDNSFGVPTPWGTFINYAMANPRSGIFFEVASQRKGLSPAVGLSKLGNVMYSAMAIDAQAQVIYLASQSPRGYLFRYKPSLWGNMNAGGLFEVLCIQRWSGADSRNVDPTVLSMQVGGYYQTYWLPINDGVLFGPQVIQNAVEFGEIADMTWLNQKLYWVSSDSGKTQDGQLFEFDGYNLRLVEEFDAAQQRLLSGPVALTSLNQGLLMATGSSEGAGLFWQQKDGSWQQLWQRDSALGRAGDLAVDPLTRYIYMSMPKDGNVLRLRRQ